MTTRTYRSGPRYRLLRSRLAGTTRLAIQLRRRIRRWLALSRQRRALAELDNRLLKDLGLERETAAQEAARWFWDDPANRG